MKSSTRMNVVVATTEIVPYSKVGGLADVMGALPDELEQIGCRLTVITPLYASIDRQAFGIAAVGGLPLLAVDVAGRRVPFGLRSAVKPGTGIRVYFVENEEYYGRDGIYTTAAGEAFPDEDERTIFFNRAVVETIAKLGISPDIVHCNDFHTGLVPALIEIERGSDPLFETTATVFSVHNLAYQGIFERDFIVKAGLDPALFSPMSPFEYWGRVNVMKVGLSYASVISTVSRTYAEEIMSSEEYGYGLEGVIAARRDSVVGILNGIDPGAWDPAADDLIPAAFTADDLSGKARNKAALAEAFDLDATPDVPVIGMVSRLVDQKGFDILAEALASIMEEPVAFAILGTGQQKYHELYTELAGAYPGRMGVRLEFNNALAHLVEAGSDFFLMPSRYEPCGLNQMYSLRYGTFPIVRETGGLKDTIDGLSPKGAKGNGFTFVEYDPETLADAVKRAVRFYRDEKAVARARARVMREDHSWRRSAKEYVKLYGMAGSRAGMGLTT
ncbi:MAG: glycogen synthase [Candidatus Krumholzibacteriota bacterium]|nr:glycogen synthase [Candidatus Krumholzibacteriota bacterium]